MNIQDDNMHQGAPPSSFEKAQALRNKMTPAEIKLWDVLKQKRFHSLKFRRQHPVQLFIADFYCHQLKLVIEVDGHYHLTEQQRTADNERTEELENLGLTVLRFSNTEFLTDIDAVLASISTWIISQNPTLYGWGKDFDGRKSIPPFPSSKGR